MTRLSLRGGGGFQGLGFKARGCNTRGPKPSLPLQATGDTLNFLRLHMVVVMVSTRMTRIAVNAIITLPTTINDLAIMSYCYYKRILRVYGAWAQMRGCSVCCQ